MNSPKAANPMLASRRRGWGLAAAVAVVAYLAWACREMERLVPCDEEGHSFRP